MNDLLRIVLSLSVSGGILTLVLFALKPLIRNRFRKTWQYYIWLVIIVRFLIPFTSEQSLVGKWFQVTEAPEQTTITQHSDLEIPFENIEVASDNQKLVSSDKVSFFAGWGAENYILLVWFLGILLLFVRKVTSYQGFLQYIKSGCIEVSVPALLNLYGEVCEEQKVKHSPELYTNSMVSTPMMVGFWRPFIVIPSADTGESELRNILRHELIHYRRFDTFYKWLIQFTVCIHWFNPIVYYMSRELRRNCELSCDEAVIESMSAEEKRTYGNTLLSALKIDGNYPASVVSVTLNEDARNMKERLEAIMKFQKKSNKRAVYSVLLAAVICFGTIITGAYLPDKQIPAQAGVRKENNTASSNVSKEWEEINETAAAKDVSWENTSYNSSCFYENGYMIRLKWNVNTSKYSSDIKIPGTNYHVALDENTKIYASNSAVLKAVGQAISEQVKIEERDRKNGSYTRYTIESPLLSKVEGPYKESLNELVKKFYEDDNIPYFAAVAYKADKATRQTYVKRSVSDGKISYFSILSDTLTAKERGSYAEIAYNNDDIAIFSILADELTHAEQAKYAKKAAKDGKTAFFSYLADELTAKEKGSYAEIAYNNNDIAIFCIITDELTHADQAKYAKKAAEDGKTAFFSNLVDGLTAKDIGTYAEIAYKNNDIEIFCILADELTHADQAKYAKKAVSDGRIAFVNILMN